jgi:hypothetical protein
MLAGASGASRTRPTVAAIMFAGLHCQATGPANETSRRGLAVATLTMFAAEVSMAEIVAPERTA